MKKLIIACGFLTASTVVSYAQSTQNAQTTMTAQPAAPAKTQAAPAPNRTPVTPEMIAERRAKMYQQQYNLTPEQYKGVYAAELDFMKENQQMRASGTQPTQQQMQQMEMAKSEKFKAVMTPDQYKRYEIMSGRHGGPMTPTTQPQQAAPAKAPATK